MSSYSSVENWVIVHHGMEVVQSNLWREYKTQQASAAFQFLCLSDIEQPIAESWQQSFWLSNMLNEPNHLTPLAPEYQGDFAFTLQVSMLKSDFLLFVFGCCSMSMCNFILCDVPSRLKNYI